tara:strand:+ start:1101 stop:3356 length:2256 start_codon:yes stop_codon:yes gene_type:complete
MRKNFSRINAVLLALLLCASLLPQNVAADETTTEHFAFGMEYDWSDMDTDFETMTGLELDEILGDVMQSADDAGIDLLILEELTGTSSMIIDQYEDGTTMLDYDGSTVEVTKHVTELTVRHGQLADLAIITEWSDARAGWDLTISANADGVFNIDAFYVEYRDADDLLYGHDLEMSMEADQTYGFGLQGSLEADDGDKVMPLNIQMGMSVDYSVSNAESSVLYTEPSDIHQQLSALAGGEDLGWEVGSDDDDGYVYWNDLSSNDFSCSWVSMYEEYECYHAVYDYYDYYPYCEYYSTLETYYCTYDFGHDSAWEDSLTWTHKYDNTRPNTGDEAEPHSGDFTTSTGFNFELTGLPAEEFGFPAGKWDISASDSVTDTGSFSDEEYRCEMGIELFEGTQMITTDGEQIEVMQAYTSPLPWGMTCHIANLFLHAFEGTEDAPTLADMIEDSTEEIAESFDDGSNSDYVTGQYLGIEMYASGQDDISVYYDATGLDYDGDYEIDLILTNSDGTTEDVDSVAFSGDYHWGNSYMSSDSWGEHCLTAELQDTGTGQTLDTLNVCANVPQEIEPSQLLEDIVEGFSESTLENVMENFGENMEYRMEDYEADFPYDDGDMFVLWDTNSNMVVGFQMVVTTDESNLWYTLIGPESDSYGTAPAPLSVTYFSGSQAIVQEAEIVEDTTLSDLVDLTQHNDDIIEDALEEALAEYGDGEGGSAEETEEETESGLLPFVSPVLTIALIAIAGLVASLQSRKD